MLPGVYLSNPTDHNLIIHLPFPKYICCLYSASAKSNLSSDSIQDIAQCIDHAFHSPHVGSTNIKLSTKPWNTLPLQASSHLKIRHHQQPKQPPLCLLVFWLTLAMNPSSLTSTQPNQLTSQSLSSAAHTHSPIQLFRHVRVFRAQTLPEPSNPWTVSLFLHFSLCPQHVMWGGSTPKLFILQIVPNLSNQHWLPPLSQKYLKQHPLLQWLSQKQQSCCPQFHPTSPSEQIHFCLLPLLPCLQAVGIGAIDIRLMPSKLTHPTSLADPYPLLTQSSPQQWYMLPLPQFIILPSDQSSLLNCNHNPSPPHLTHFDVCLWATAYPLPWYLYLFDNHFFLFSHIVCLLTICHH